MAQVFTNNSKVSGTQNFRTDTKNLQGAPMCRPSNTWFLGPTIVHIPNGILIGWAIFAGFTINTASVATGCIYIVLQCGLITVTTWHSGSALVSINKVNLCRAQLVSTGIGDRLWAGKPSQYVTSHRGQLRVLLQSQKLPECWTNNSIPFQHTDFLVDRQHII